eukprot:c19665_g1_i5.p1 GENE.c19665_g1_i5~~c19665_g1_i5.p1  ORF type:complete len:230 (+),score=28.65 c19665_g1_i5:92-781(+)
MVYHDFEGSVFASNILVNDLDLTVRCDFGCDSFSSNIWYPNGLNEPDSINNSEQVVIPRQLLAVGQKYLIQVAPHKVPKGPQPFALAITGNFRPLTNGSGLSSGAISGIVVGCLIGLYIVASIAYGRVTRGSWHASSLCCLPQMIWKSTVRLCCVSRTGALLPGTYSTAATSKPTSSKGWLPRLPPKIRPGSEWSCHVDPRSGRRYWYNTLTGKSTWSDPFLTKSLVDA